MAGQDILGTNKQSYYLHTFRNMSKVVSVGQDTHYILVKYFKESTWT